MNMPNEAAQGAMPDIEQMRRVLASAAPQLLALPGVTGIDIGRKIVDGKKTDTLAIRVYVEHKSDVPPEDAVPKFIQGVPTDVIERRFSLHA